MAQGPRLADAWDIDRKMALALGAWIEMRQRLASYNAVASVPWTEDIVSRNRFEAARWLQTIRCRRRNRPASPTDEP
jgi:hypothetical protein